MTATVEPFRIAVPDEVLSDLKERLSRTRLPSAVKDAGWEYGTNPEYLEELITYWRDEYDWRRAEAALNAMPQYMAQVDGFRLHFVHAPGKGPNPIPLLFSHGWPGSFWEVSKIIGPLTDPAAHGGDPADTFTLVAPSLPGYGFSPDPRRPGVNPGVIGDLFASLMTDTLGYSRFGAQGGDWGSMITSWLGYAHADKLIGLHLNLMGVRPYTGPDTPPMTDAEKQFIAEWRRYSEGETGYYNIQATKPQTLAYGLNDSPAGLAAWIVEKFRTWSDCHGDVERSYSKDELLTNVMIYWVTGSIGSSARLYYEWTRQGWKLKPGERITVPTGYARFAKEITRPPREWVERGFNVQHWSEFPRGGHFAAVEEPELLVEDLRRFFRPLRPG